MQQTCCENHQKRKHGGTGLSLAISKRLVALIDGSINLEPEPRVVSRFVFTVKLTAFQEIPAKTDNISIENINFPGKRVLLAEDIEINREILTAQLEGTELTINIAHNVKEAMEIIIAATKSYDIILMHVQMLETDGLEATRQIHALPHGKKLPIIATIAPVLRKMLNVVLSQKGTTTQENPLIYTLFLKNCRNIYTYNFGGEKNGV